MTNKILITIVVPMIEEKFDIYIPVSKSVRVTKQLLTKTIHELSGEHFPKNKNCILMSNNGKEYDDNFNIKDSGIKNGDKLILI